MSSTGSSVPAAGRRSPCGILFPLSTAGRLAPRPPAERWPETVATIEPGPSRPTSWSSAPRASSLLYLGRRQAIAPAHHGVGRRADPEAGGLERQAAAACAAGGGLAR